MRKLTNLGSALVVASLVATGMVTFNAPLAAAGFGGGWSQTSLCNLLAAAEAKVLSLPDSQFKTTLLAHIDAQQASLKCGA